MGLVIPFAMARTRKSYLTDFLLSAQQEEGFVNSIRDNSSISYEASAYALEMLSFFDLYEVEGWFGAVEANVNVSVLSGEIEDELEANVDDLDATIYDIYFLLKSLDLLNSTISSSLEEDIVAFLDASEQVGGGFGATNTSTTANLAATYFSLKTLDLLGEDQQNPESTRLWVRDCYNSDGGYGGNSSLESTIANTFYAILLLRDFYESDDFNDEEQTLEYLTSFYVDEEADELNYGGYLPHKDASYAKLSSTYYCVSIINIIDQSKLNNESTANWVLSKQSFTNGGFSDYSEGHDRYISTVTCSYFAFHVLKTFDTDLLYLEEQVWMAEFNWIIFMIVLIVLGAVIAVAILIWRKRRI